MRKILFLIVLLSLGCDNNTNNKSSAKSVIKNIKEYSADSNLVVSTIYNLINAKEIPFASREYFDSTLIIVDTIIYDNSKNKLATFVIAKNPVSRNPRLESENKYYYNAFCFIGKVARIDSSSVQLMRLGPYTLQNFEDSIEIEKALREYYFHSLTGLRGQNNERAFNYNIIDPGFWDDSTGWNRFSWH